MIDNKKAIATIIAKRNKMPGVPAVHETDVHTSDTDGRLDPIRMAAEDVMEAIHKQSTPHLMKALQNFHDMHALHRSHEDRGNESDLPDL